MSSQVRWIFVWQAVATVLALLVAGASGGVHAAISALVGGVIGILGGMAYVWRAMRTGGDPGKAYRAQVAGEAYKFAVTLSLFAVVFINYRQLEPLPLFVTFAVTFVAYWAALLKKN